MRPASSWPRSWALCSRCRLRECYSGLRLVARPCQRMAQEPVQPDGDPQDVDGKPSGAVASEAFGSMRMIIATLTTPARVDELALAAWCLVHGYGHFVSRTAWRMSGGALSVHACLPACCARMLMALARRDGGAAGQVPAPTACLQWVQTSPSKTARGPDPAFCH